MRPNIFTFRPFYGLIVLSFCLLGTAAAQAQDPFERLKQAAAKDPVDKKDIGSANIAENDARVKVNKKNAIPFKPFEQKDSKGKALADNDQVELATGKKMTAKQFFQQLNDMEKSLNAQGFSLRDSTKAMVKDIITPASDLDGKVATTPKAEGAFKDEKDRDNFMNTTRQVGNTRIKPLDESNPDERKKNSLTKFSTDASGNLVSSGTFDANVLTSSVTATSTTPLRTINETTSRTWTFGNASTFQAGITGELLRSAKIYKFDPANPATSQNEYRVTAKGRVFGSLFGYTQNLLTANAEFFAPANTTKPMTAKVQLVVAGITVLNINESLAQSKTFASGWWGRSIDRGVPITIPICCGVSFSGKIGVRGNAGIGYNGSIYRTIVSLNAQPTASLSGYAEAGIDILGIAKLGVGGQLTFVQGNVPLNAYVGVYSQNATQIVVGYGYYAGYNLTMLKGRIYGFADVCAWLLGCYRLGEVNFHNWAGYVQSGTIAQGSFSYVIANI